jgi:hypothetical protein
MIVLLVIGFLLLVLIYGSTATYSDPKPKRPKQSWDVKRDDYSGDDWGW